MALVALVGDRNDEHVAHRAIPASLAQLRGVDHEWVGTEMVGSGAGLARFNGVWCVPASPYRDMQGALTAIRWARENGRPFLGTCGGFQHAMIEYAQSVLGWTDAEHAESAPGAVRQVITPLACALLGVSDELLLVPGSRLARAVGSLALIGTYQCAFGLNPAFAETLTAGPLRAAARNRAGEVRGVELDGHPFFVAVLFQPEREALVGAVSPIVRAFVEASRSVASSADRASARRDP